MMAHKHAADLAEHLAEASKLLSTPGIITLVNTTAQPLVGIHLPDHESVHSGSRKET